MIGNGLPVQLEISPVLADDQPMAMLLLQKLSAGADVIADKGYDENWIRESIEDPDCSLVIRPKSNRYGGVTYSKTKYCKRNLIKRCFNELKQSRHIASPYDRFGFGYLALSKLPAVRLWFRFYGSAP